MSNEKIADLRRKAEQGDATAQNNLGVLYYIGNGVPQDYGIARQWYESAAAQGLAPAQITLGHLYADGKGVPKDEKKGVEWIRKAAEQGDGIGQASLGDMYRDGRGVPQDNVLAYMWYSLAVADWMSAEQNLGKVARHMTPAQIAEAQRLAQQCQARQFKGC